MEQLSKQRSPFDKLRANGMMVDMMNFYPFVLSLSKHKIGLSNDPEIGDRAVIIMWLYRLYGLSPICCRRTPNETGIVTVIRL